MFVVIVLVSSEEFLILINSSVLDLVVNICRLIKMRFIFKIIFFRVLTYVTTLNFLVDLKCIKLEF